VVVAILCFVDRFLTHCVCSDVRKIKPLLDHLEALQKLTNYFALDLSHETLIEAMARLSPNYKYVRCYGLWGTFDDGLKWAEKIPGPRFFFSLGSIFGNDFFESAVERLRPWAEAMRPADRMLLGMDATKNVDEIWDSYHDKDGLFEKFMRNGLVHSNRVLGQCWYKAEDWDVLGILETDPVMHRFVFRALREVVCRPLGLEFAAGDEIDCYEAFKYGPETMRKQYDRTGLKEIATWKAPSGRICKSVLMPVPEMNAPNQLSLTDMLSVNSRPVPTPHEHERGGCCEQFLKNCFSEGALLQQREPTS